MDDGPAFDFGQQEAVLERQARQSHPPATLTDEVVQGDRQTIRLGLHKRFSQKLTNLFQDHETARP